MEICTFIHMQGRLDAHSLHGGKTKLAEQVGHTDSQTSGSHVVKCIYTQSVQHYLTILQLRPLEVSRQLEELEPRFPYKAPELQTTSKRVWRC